MSRSERLYLTEIIDAAREIEEFFISSDLKARHPERPRRRVIAFRNIAVHEYFAVDWAIVWTAATKNTPALAGLVIAMLTKEFPDPE